MPDQMEAPPVTRRENDVARRWGERHARRSPAQPVPELETDLLLMLDLVALLRADLSVAMIRVTSWARLARELQEAIAVARAEGCTHAPAR